MKKMNKIYMWAAMSMLSFTSLSVHAFDVRSNQPVFTETQGECDSLFITGVKGFAVKNVTMTKKTVSFVVCNSTSNKVKQVPWAQIQYIKKADGRIITADKKYENDTPEKLEKQVKNLLIISIISFFLGLRLIFGIIIWIKAAKYRKKIHGHPKEKKLNKQLNWAVGSSIILIILFILSIFVMKYLLDHAFDNLFNWNYDPQ